MLCIYVVHLKISLGLCVTKLASYDAVRISEDFPRIQVIYTRTVDSLYNMVYYDKLLYKA